MKYIVNKKGKQLRPIIVILSAKLHGEVTPTTYRAAVMIELLHTATLIHDDVVDNAIERRGFFSINALWKNKIAVLIGDYLLSIGLLLSLDNNDYVLLQILSKAIKLMSEAELLQIEKSKSLQTQEDIYFDIIKGKTSSLIAAAYQMGTITTTKNENTLSTMQLIGEKVGIAFQMEDDLLDFMPRSKIGKPQYNDLREQKTTLPIIYTLKHIAQNEQKRFITLIRKKNKTIKELNYINHQIKQTGGFNYTKEKIQSYNNESIQLLHSFKESPYRDAMEHLINFLTKRTK